MSNLTISIFGNKVFLEILKELNLFENAKITLLDDIEHTFLNENIVVFFLNELNVDFFYLLKNKNLPILLIDENLDGKRKWNNIAEYQITPPFKILNFKKKIIATLASHKYKKSSLIKLGEYIINKNERKIKKGDLELKLTEKEVNFLILFTYHTRPISKNFILKNLWKYSVESDTHTVETHIHRLRKKILNKFNDNSFIKNNKQGYYI